MEMQAGVLDARGYPSSMGQLTCMALLTTAFTPHRRRRPFFQPYHLIVIQDGDPSRNVGVPDGYVEGLPFTQAVDGGDRDKADPC